MDGTSGTSAFIMRSGSYLKNSMAEYAFQRYKYVLTPEDIHEIRTEAYWNNNVDEFCTYMITVNFGETIPGTSNVKLPKTLKIYSSEEVDVMDEEARQSPSRTEYMGPPLN